MDTGTGLAYLGFFSLIGIAIYSTGSLFPLILLIWTNDLLR